MSADPPSGWDIAALASSAAALVATIGAGAKWLLTMLFAREDRTNDRLETRVATLERDMRSLLMAINYLVPALHTVDPGNPALKIVTKLLRDKFPIDLIIPDEMRSELGRMK